MKWLSPPNDLSNQFVSQGQWFQSWPWFEYFKFSSGTNSLLRHQTQWIRPLHIGLYQYSDSDSTLHFFLGSLSILRTHSVHGATIEWCYGSVLQWCHGWGGHSSFPTSIAIDLSAMSFEHSPCHTCNSLMFFVLHVTWFGLWYLLKMFHFFPQIVISCYGWFTSLPFFRHSSRGKKQQISPDPQEFQIVHGLQTLLIHIRPISMVCEPCRGCEVFNNIGFELDIL